MPSKRTCQFLIYTPSELYSCMSRASRSALDIHILLLRYIHNIYISYIICYMSVHLPYQYILSIQCFYYCRVTLGAKKYRFLPSMNETNMLDVSYEYLDLKRFHNVLFFFRPFLLCIIYYFYFQK